MITSTFAGENHKGVALDWSNFVSGMAAPEAAHPLAEDEDIAECQMTQQIALPTKVNFQLGIHDISRLSSMWSYLVAFVIVLASTRGLIVIYLNIPAKTVYNAVAALLVILSAWGCLKSSTDAHPDLVLLRKLLLINVLLGIVNIAVDLIFGMPADVSVLWIYLAPYAVFLFLRVPISYLNAAMTMIAIAIGFSIIGNFIETLKGPEGVQNVVDYCTKLRPDTFDALGAANQYYRIPGCTGSQHDSANIMGMVAAYYLVRYMIKGKILDVGLAVFTIVCLMLTLSATNIILSLFCCSIFALYVLVVRRKFAMLYYLLLVLVAIIGLAVYFNDFLANFYSARIQEGDWSGMMNQLDNLLSAIPFFIAGHATAYGSQFMGTEVAHLKTIAEVGILHACIFFLILLYPVWRFLKVRSWCPDALPAVAAILFGFMSLLHYGSLLRSTSVFLFYAICAVCLLHIRNCDDSRWLSERKDAANESR